MCTSFSECSDELCDALAKCARRLATTYVDPTSLEAYVACRLIPLDKKPGVRPIGIGEVMRRILGKAILRLTNQDIKEAAGSLQLCAGQENGIEAAIHAMHDVFQDEETEGILLADASNAFNRLNRAVCLRNVQHLCPSLAPTVINSYRQPARLFVGGECIMSSEGTTQGDPIAMPMYAIGVVPLLQSIATEGAVQACFADDSSRWQGAQAPPVVGLPDRERPLIWLLSQRSQIGPSRQAAALSQGGGGLCRHWSGHQNGRLPTFRRGLGLPGVHHSVPAAEGRSMGPGGQPADRDRGDATPGGLFGVCPWTQTQVDIPKQGDVRCGCCHGSSRGGGHG